MSLDLYTLDVEIADWVSIEGSKKEELFENRKTSETQISTEDGYEECVKYFGSIAPHIKWRINYAIGPYGVPDSTQGRIICVPQNNSNEADYIVERYKSGEGFTDYSYKDKYPDVFVKGGIGKKFFIRISKILSKYLKIM